MTYYTEYLEQFLLKIKVPYVSRSNILHIYDCITITEEKCKRIDEIISKYQDINFDYQLVLKEFEDFALPRLRNKCEVDCLCICLLTKKLEELYKKNGLSEELFTETMSDIRYKINECEMVKKLSGIFCASWYEDFFRLKTFGLGRLQFQITNNCYEIPGFDKDFKMLAVHIPKSGERLDPERVDKSFAIAKEFFKKHFNMNEIVFCCHSWILFPENKKFLSKDSNIAKFSSRFEIISTSYDKDYSELWRIFDREFNGLRSLKEDSSLRRGYKELVKNNKPIGEGIGYFRG